MTAPVFRLRDIALYERPVTLRLPFRFGVITLRAAPQAFVRLRLALPDGREAWGMAAELMIPKWFDKSPSRSHEENIADLRLSLRHAAAAYASDRQPASGFGLSARHHAALLAAGAQSGLNPLVASYGPALLDRAIMDALARLHGLPFHRALAANLFGIDATLTSDLAGFDIGKFLGGLRPGEHIEARHTVGLIDPLREADIAPAERLEDGLPQSLEAVIARYGHRWFKLKVGGDIQADLARLTDIAAILDAKAGSYQASLDGNEQYDDVDGIAALWQAMRAEPKLARLCAAIGYIEQPIKRDAALSRDVASLAAEKPLIVDESDSDYGVFPAARALGYAGISSKTCKGAYKAILNAARVAQWNMGNAEAGAPRFFLSAEDLTTQAGLCVQQDLALVSSLGLGHVERNGHHYVDGFGDAPAAEAKGFAAAHPDLYESAAGRPRLAIRQGRIALGSLHAAPGFASAAEPDWTSLSPLNDLTGSNA